jgi:transporter family protein
MHIIQIHARSTYPFFGTSFAILLLGEHPTVFLWLGMLFVIVGSILIQSPKCDEEALVSPKRGLILPISGSLIAGLGYALKKIGLNTYDEPMMGVAIAYISTLILSSFIFIVSPKTRRSTTVNPSTLMLFWKGGLCFAIAYLLAFYAIQFGEISVVAPLTQTEPLFLLVLSYFYLRKSVTFSKKLVLGTVIIVAGVMIISAFGL